MEKINACEDCVSRDERPKTLQQGLLLLADWFDAVYQDQGKNDAVQQDLRKWASDVSALLADVRALVNFVKELIEPSNEHIDCDCIHCNAGKSIAAVERHLEGQ